MGNVTPQFWMLLSGVVIIVLIVLHPLIILLWDIAKLLISLLVPIAIAVIFFRALGWLFSKSLDRTDDSFLEHLRFGDKEEDE